jgi:hypothetical protein
MLELVLLISQIVKPLDLNDLTTVSKSYFLHNKHVQHLDIFYWNLCSSFCIYVHIKIIQIEFHFFDQVQNGHEVQNYFNACPKQSTVLFLGSY